MSYEQLAAALLMHAEDPDVAGFLLSHAELSDPLELPTSPRGVDDAALKGAWARAATEAASSTDPDRLAHLAGNNSLKVKRAVAANPATPPDARIALLAEAITKGDHELGIALVPQLDAADIAAELSRPDRVHGRGFPYNPAIKKIVEDVGVVGSVRLAGALDNNRLHLMFRILSEHRLDPEPALTRLTERSDVDHADLAARLAKLSHVSEPIVHYVLERHSPTSLEHLFPSLETVTPEALEVLLADGRPALSSALARAALTAGPDQQRRAVNQCGPCGLNVLAYDLWKARRAGNHGELATAVGREILATAESSSAQSPTAQTALRTACSHLVECGIQDPEVAVGLLRWADAGTTASWITTPEGTVVSAEMLEQLLERPGHALQHPRGEPPTTSTDMLVRFLNMESHLLRLRACPWADDVVDLLGAPMLERLVGNPEGGAYLARRFTDAFGSQRELWYAAMELAAAGFDGSVGDLVSTVTNLHS